MEPGSQKVSVKGANLPLKPFKAALKETTDLALFVRTSSETILDWNRQRIVDALLRETNIAQEVAEKISREVEEQIISSKISLVTAPLIRELVDAKLIEYGLEEARKKHTRLGVPLYDVDQLILHPNRENANVPHGPEATNLTLAERIKKEYALLNVFAQEIGDAHMRGDIHLHDLGFIDRPYCSGQSLEYIKKFGLNLPNSLSMAKPAKHPEVLLAHMVKFAAALQSHFAGAIGWDAVNLFFAPYLVGLSDREIHQLAQMLIYEFSQQAVARGGQAIFTDINLYWEVPKHFEKVMAIGPGGEFTGKTYAEYAPEAQRFVWALFDVYREGDAVGRPFFFPKPLVHITEKFFQTPGHLDFLAHICEVAAEKGNTYFVFDRGSTAKVSECCRLSFKLEEADLEDAQYPWRMRYCALQNVTLNLPRLAYQSAGSDEQLFTKIAQVFNIAVQAHLQKKAFLERLLALGAEGPLALLTMNKDGLPYLRLARATYLIGMVGLNEMVQIHLGKQLHESDEALKFGLKVIAYMKLLADKMSRQYNMRFVLEQTPAESTAYRFAKLDLRDFSPRAGYIVKGDISRGEIYYSNSTYLNVGAPLNPIDRVRKEGLFHPLIEAGALTHLWLGEARPSKDSLANFIIKVFRNSQNDQIAFSPEFTACPDCARTSRGLQEKCPYCGSANVEGITRITGYFTKISSWNKGKLGELKDRFRNQNYFLEKDGGKAKDSRPALSREETSRTFI
ncbi:MAG: anaerobic ribonucleoside-triphosphate reductase [Thermodesulfobacteriota bacterium]